MNTQVSTPSVWRRLLNEARSMGRPLVVHTVAHNDTGLHIESLYRNGTAIMADVIWAEVTTVLAFKRDCFTVDLICVAFENDKGNVEIHEEMPMWDSIIKALPQYLPGCMAHHEWFQQVAFPAFATNPVHIYRRTSTENG